MSAIASIVDLLLKILIVTRILTSEPSSSGQMKHCLWCRVTNANLDKFILANSTVNITEEGTQKISLPAQNETSLVLDRGDFASGMSVSAKYVSDERGKA